MIRICNIYSKGFGNVDKNSIVSPRYKPQMAYLFDLNVNASMQNTAFTFPAVTRI